MKLDLTIREIKILIHQNKKEVKGEPNLILKKLKRHLQDKVNESKRQEKINEIKLQENSFEEVKPKEKKSILQILGEWGAAARWAIHH